MQAVVSASLLTGVGLEGDKHAEAKSRRQVLLVDRETLDALGLLPGSIKENLTVEGLNVMSLPPGTQIRLGADALVEITSVCEPCFRMDEIRLGLKGQLVGRRGMNAVVVRGGTINVSDPISIEAVQPLAS
jgi:MOSC domain-containing protein YiiM